MDGSDRLEARQRALEQRALALAEDRYRRARRGAAPRRVSASETAAGTRFLDGTVLTLAEAIEAEQRALIESTGPHRTYALPMLALDRTTLAFLALRTIYNRAATGDDEEDPTYNDIAATIGKACHREWKARRDDAARRQAAAEETAAADEGAVRRREEAAPADEGGSIPALPELAPLLAARDRSRNAARRARERAAAFEASGWSVKVAGALGGRLLDLAESCALVAVDEEVGGGGEILRVRLTAAWSRGDAPADDAGARLLATPAYAPMVAPPRPWTGLEGGGFLTVEDPELTHLVKHHGHTGTKAALEMAAGDGTLRPVLDAVNALQGTAWRLNRPLLALLAHAWAARLPLPGLPDRARLAALQGQLDPLNDERAALRARRRGLKQRRQATALPGAAPDPEVAPLRAALARDWADYRARGKTTGALRRERAGLASRVYQFEATLGSCDLLTGAAPEDADGGPRLYFPYQLDYRGRAYAMVPTPSPQGGDAARALLEFADGKALGPGPRPEGWLAIHLANMHGQDKVSFEAREDWVRAHDGPIRDLARLVDPASGSPGALLAALAPATRALWDEAEEPWQFLAACREWAGRGTPGFVSRLPIALDGSASGYQHLSALARDRAGAEATNLIDHEHPSDLYGRVADALRPGVEADAAAGVARAVAWLDPATGRATRVTRRAVKRSVMTIPYGVTRPTQRGQILEYLEVAVPDAPDTLWGVADYLAGKLAGAVEEVVGNAPGVMQWLRGVASVLFVEYGRGVAWTAPSGFPVVVAHYRRGVERITWTPTGAKEPRSFTLRVGWQEHLGVDPQEQRRTIAPNFVHALDAAHLTLTIRRLHDEGLRHFAVIHDSFGVHACDADRLVCALREEFARMYREPLLARFLDAQIAALPAGAPSAALEALRPKIPITGDLDLDEVLRARYMFA